MSTLELKGGMYDMIAKINDKELLLRLYQIIAEVIRENLDQTDFWEELSKEQIKELEMAIKESYQRENLIDQEMVVKKFQKWLNR